ncbi:MAG: MMPL family transporter [Lachnospiraceae bacterium]|nr:MMPL family transporter [Lachnospiraceae bacterium]
MISKLSVKKPYTVLVAVVLVIILGVVSFTKMTTDLFPNINLPYVIVMTTYPGANPETVEMVVTKPVEQSMATVSNIENISSISSENYSMVVLEFAQTANMDSVSLEIRESLDQIRGFWDDSIGNPIIMKLNPDMMPVMVAAIGVEGMSNAEITDLASNHLIPELESLEGVASVDASGLVEESVHVIIRQEKIDAVNLQVFGYIEGEFADAEQELSDARKELQEGQQELNDSRQDMLEGRQELLDGQTEVQEKRQEIDEGIDAYKEGKSQATEQLATQKKQLEEGLAQVEQGIVAIDERLNTAEYKGHQDRLSDAKVVYQGLGGVLAQFADRFSDPALLTDPEALQALMQEVMGALGSFEATLTDSQKVIYGEIMMESAGDPQQVATVAEEKVKAAQDALDDYENTPSVRMLLESKEELENTKAQLTQGLTDLGISEAAANAQLSGTEFQLNYYKSTLEQAQEQLDSALEQLDDGEEQMQDAQKQLNEGWEQLRDGEEELEEQKGNALDAADMTNILTVDTVKSLLAAQNFSMPGGYVTEEGIDYLVRIGDKPGDVEALANMPLMNLEMDGVDTIYLRDVADVFMTDNAQDSYTNINGNPGILLSIQKQTGYSTGDVSRKLSARFQEMMEEDQSLEIVPLMDQGIYIDLVMDSILSNILFGAVLAILILILFLRDIRPTFVIACSIPISLVTALVCMYFSGVTLNIISLSGLALGIGMLVDNSIVVIENIYRMRSEGVPMKEAAIEGAQEVGGAILASTLTTVCVFAPIVFTEGITRQLFVDMGLTIGYSLLASLIIAMTVVPAMASKVLVKTEEKKESRFFTGMIAGYEKLLSLSLRGKPLVVLGAVVLLVVSALAAASNGTAFMEDMDSTQISATVELEKGSSLADTRAVTDEAISRIMTIEDVQDVGAMTGGEMSMFMGGGEDNTASVYITLKEDKTRTNEEIGKEILELTADLDCEFSVETSSMDMSALGGSGIQINVKGRELDTLQEIATDLAKKLEEMEGLTEISDGQEETTGELRVIVDRDKAISQGLTVAQVFSMLNAKLADPSSATTLMTEIKDYDVLVMNGDDIELTRDTLEQLVLTVSKKDGTYEHIPLSDIATFERTEGVKSIQRDAQSRVISVTASIADGYNIGLVGNQVQKMLDHYDVPGGYSLHMTGEDETINEAMEQLVLMLALAVAFMYLIMVAQFQSLLSPFIIMFTIPLAFTGGFMALFIGGFEISVIAMIGFVMLSGIIVNNGIVLIDYMNQLREEGMEKRDAILEAGKTRLRPVLMTALTTILAMSTMVVSSDMGADMARPMAVVTIGGLLYGTLLTLFVIPCIYDWFIRGKKSTKEETAA